MERGGTWRCVVALSSEWRCVLVRGGAWRCVIARGSTWRCVLVCGGSCWRVVAPPWRRPRVCVGLEQIHWKAPPCTCCLKRRHQETRAGQNGGAGTGPWTDGPPAPRRRGRRPGGVRPRSPRELSRGESLWTPGPHGHFRRVQDLQPVLRGGENQRPGCLRHLGEGGRTLTVSSRDSAGNQRSKSGWWCRGGDTWPRPPHLLSWSPDLNRAVVGPAPAPAPATSPTRPRQAEVALGPHFLHQNLRAESGFLSLPAVRTG